MADSAFLNQGLTEIRCLHFIKETLTHWLRSAWSIIGKYETQAFCKIIEVLFSFESIFLTF